MSRLAEIRERFNAIIPGPWRWRGNTETDHLFLGTVDRGQLYVLTIGTRTEQYVYVHNYGESYLLSSISNTRVREWCGGHDEHGGDDTDGCICQEIADFLKGDLLIEDGTRDFEHDRRPFARPMLTRGIAVHPDLRFVVPFDGDKATGGGMMRSYRQCNPKYEVLGYRTVTEWEGDQGGALDARDALYRQDFAGFDNAEATFIERAPEDIGYLLKRLEAAEGLIVALRNWVTWESRGQALQGTADARVLAVRAEREWDDACAEEQ